MSICWKCGQDEGTAHYNGKGCPTGLASIVGSPCFITDPTSTLEVVHTGLEKIEPLSMVYTGHTENGISYCTGSRPADNRELMTKLNEVIEAVNKMMEVMNKESSKQKNQRTDKQSPCPKSTK